MPYVGASWIWRGNYYTITCVRGDTIFMIEDGWDRMFKQTKDKYGWTDPVAI